MPWSVTVGRIAGTAIRIHVTFLLFLLWIWGSYYRMGGAGAAWEGVLFVVLLFLCVLLHEFGHVAAARRYGIQTGDITLWPFGGIASLERIPEKPAEELVVAIAGPLVNVAIAAVLIGLIGLHAEPEHLSRIDDPHLGILVKLASANIFLVLFNLIPAFPMDGGRVLRAVLAMRMGNARATNLAASIGQGVAVLLGIFGVFVNPMLVVIAIFVFLAASGEASQVQMREASRGVIVADAMITHFETLGPQATVSDAAEALIRTTQREFPVVDGAGHLRGVLTRDAMIRALQAVGPGASVLDVMEREVPTVGARAPLESALRLLTQTRAPAVGVLDAAGRLVGLLTVENVGELMTLQAARPQRPLRPWSRAGAR